MALAKDSISKHGAAITYHRVCDVRGTRISVASYVDEASRQGGKPPVQTLTLAAPQSYFTEAALKEAGCSALSQAYSFLKSLPEYSGAEDV